MSFEYSDGDGNIRLLSRRLFPALVLGTIGVFLTFIGLSVFARPSADDFCYAAKVRHLGFFEALSFWYFHWSGRYTSNLTLSAFGALGNIVTTYPYGAIFILVSTWLSFSFLASTVARCIVSFRFPLLVGAIATILFLAETPDPAQTFYWLTGSFDNQLGNIFLIVLVALMIRRETIADRQPFSGLVLLSSVLLTIAVIGTNEVSLVLTFMVIVCGSGYAIKKRRESLLYWMTLLAIGTIAVLASVLAPGNFERLSSLSTDSMLRPSPWIALFLYLPWVTLRILYWLSNLGLWASAFIALIVTSEAARKLLYIEGKFRRKFLAVPALWIGGIFALNAIGFLINRYPLPERAKSVVLLLFMLGWYPSFIILAHFLTGSRIQKLTGVSRLVATALLLISLTGAPNIFESYKDAYRGFRYAREMDERFAAIESAKNRGETEVILPSVSRPPRTLFAAELTTDPNNHRNACVSEYYGLKAIMLGTPPIPD